MILCPENQIREYTEKGWWGSETITDLFIKNAESTPDKIAVVDPPNRMQLTTGEQLRLTYSELRETVDRLAIGFLKVGIKKDDIVMVQLPNIVELVCIYLALARIGAIASPVPVQYRTHELKHTMKITEPKAFITTINFAGFNFVDMVQKLQEELPILKTIIAIGDSIPEGVVSFKELISITGEENVLNDYLAGVAISANDVFTICWTSGTEAEPKGVPRSHNHWISIAAVQVEGCGIDKGCNILNPFPFINMASIGGMFVPWLLTGGKFVLHHPFDVQIFFNQVQAEKINYPVVPPAVLNMLLQNPDFFKNSDISSIKNIGSGSAPLSSWMVRQYQEKYGIYIINLFGSNEGVCLISGPKDFPDPDDRAQFFPRWGAPGFTWNVKLADQLSTKLVDPVTKKVITKIGVPGELCIKGPTVFSGYYKRPDLTKKVFDDEGYFNTGDLFAIEGQGDNRNRYQFCGRSKDLIIRGGMNISPEELEYLIIEHPKVAEVAVLGYLDHKLGEKVCAVIVPAKNMDINLEEVIAFLKERDIAVYKLPEKILVVDSLPRNPVGKVLKRKLKELVE